MPTMTKRVRLFEALRQRQETRIPLLQPRCRIHSGNDEAGPAHGLARMVASAKREELNGVLAFAGLELTERGALSRFVRLSKL